MNCVSFLTLATETLFIHEFLPWTKSRCFNHSFRFSTPWGAKNKNRQFHGKKLKKSINTKAVCLLATEKKNALGIKMGLKWHKRIELTLIGQKYARNLTKKSTISR